MNVPRREVRAATNLVEVEEIAAPIRPDAPDARDLWYEPQSAPDELPSVVDPDNYRRYVDVTWHQRGEECTGFALAAIANYTLRRRLDDPALPSVSRRMLYEIAQLHDGEDFQVGSTLRGALKGWRLTGVARDQLWPYDPDDEFGDLHGDLTLARLLDARHRPLAAYRRIARADIDRMKDSLAAGHALFAAATLHVGWYRLFMPEVEPLIERRPADDDRGGHAVVIVGYDERGFWIHNSWGPEWGVDGYAVLPYDDWLASGLDAWVVELAPSGDIDDASSVDEGPSAADVVAYRDIWPHLVVLRDDGRLSSDGLHEMDEGSVKTLLFLFQERTARWRHRRLAVICDGGYLPPAATIERCRALRDLYMEREIYPLFVMWETSWWADLNDELECWTERVRGTADRTRPLEPDAALTREVVDASVAGPIWKETRRRARRAGTPGGGLATLGSTISKKRTSIRFDLHLVSLGVGDHSLGAILPALASPIDTVTTLVPVVSEADARGLFVPPLDDGRIGHLRLGTLDDDVEGHDAVGPVAGSLSGALRWLDGAGRDRDRLFGVGPGAGDPWDRLDATGHFERVVLPGASHVESIWDVSAHADLASMMATRTTVGVGIPPGVPSSSPVAPDRHTHAQRPTDPLAFAKTLRKRAL